MLVEELLSVECACCGASVCRLCLLWSFCLQDVLVAVELRRVGGIEREMRARRVFQCGSALLLLIIYLGVGILIFCKTEKL